LELVHQGSPSARACSGDALTSSSLRENTKSARRGVGITSGYIFTP
jgi:hypothetical protein